MNEATFEGVFWMLLPSHQAALKQRIVYLLDSEENDNRVMMEWITYD